MYIYREGYCLKNHIEISEFANKLTFILWGGWFQTSFFGFDKILNTTAGPIIGVVIVVHVAKTIVSVWILSSVVMTHSQVMPDLVCDCLKSKYRKCHFQCHVGRWLTLHKYSLRQIKYYLCSVSNFVLLCLAFSFYSVSVDTDSSVDFICLANGSHICSSQSSSFTCGCHKDIEIHLIFRLFSDWPQLWESKNVRTYKV